MRTPTKDRPRYGRKPTDWNTTDGVWLIAELMDPGTDPLQNFYPEFIDREQLPGIIEVLRTAETNTRTLRGRLEAMLNDYERHCPICDKPVTGKANRVYCGATCRQRARRARA